MYSDFSVTTGTIIAAGHQNQNMLNFRYCVSGTNSTASPASDENLKDLRTDVDQNASDIASLAQVPTGSIFSYGSGTAPTNYLNCDGSSLNKVTYSDLFDVIGFSFGGTGNTYSLPDFKDAHPRGIGTSTIFTQNGTTSLGDTVNDQFQGHVHGDPGNAFLVLGGAGIITVGGSGGSNTQTGSPASDGVNGAVRAGDQTKVHAIGVNFIIKYQ